MFGHFDWCLDISKAIQIHPHMFKRPDRLKVFGQGLKAFWSDSAFPIEAIKWEYSCMRAPEKWYISNSVMKGTLRNTSRMSLWPLLTAYMIAGTPPGLLLLGFSPLAREANTQPVLPCRQETQRGGELTKVFRISAMVGHCQRQTERLGNWRSDCLTAIATDHVDVHYANRKLSMCTSEACIW